MLSQKRLYVWMTNLLLVLCALIFICGLGLLGLGAWIAYEASSFVYALGSHSAQLNVIYISVAMGFVLTLASLIGFFGVWKKNRCFLMLFFVMLTLLFVTEFLGTVLVLVYKDLVGVVVRQTARDSLLKLYMGPDGVDPVSTAWNTVMIKFRCCGFENSTLDFKDSAFSKVTKLIYPRTCCINRTVPECDGMNVVPELIQPRSCYRKMIAVVRGHSAVLGATSGSICIVEVVAMILTMVIFVRLGMTQQ
ncbi:tetraspanin-1-like [Brachyhypopomus gauderio]|uniref:tetraspanin-1-like n=1 Tax=Brachyhypopomus gauderio TaxID=698409 RepID=UPI00404121EB